MVPSALWGGLMSSAVFIKQLVLALPRRAGLAAIVAACLLTARTASADPLPRPEEIVLPEERPVLEEIAAAMVDPGLAPDGALDLLDRSLAQLKRPTAFRGFVQFLRARCFATLNRNVAAVEAVEESIRLLPEHAAPLLLASSLFNYSDHAAKSADMLLRAIEVDPEAVRAVPGIEIRGLMRRLNEQNEGNRRSMLSERLLEINWTQGNIALRSDLAQHAIEARLRRGDVAGARRLVPKVLAPEDAYRMLSLRSFEQLWPDLETWGGMRLENLWNPYLSETRAAWRASRKAEDAYTYVQALRSAGHERTIIREMLPLLLKPLDPYGDFEFLWVVPILVDALAKDGRWDEIDLLFSHTQKAWPLGQNANALNIAANRARTLIKKGDAELGLPAMDAAIADARRWGGQVNSGALRSMHYYRACALHALRRGADAISSRDIVLADRSDTASAVNLYLCMEDRQAARQAMLLALGNRVGAEAVVTMMQSSGRRTWASERERRIQAEREKLRADPMLRQRLAPWGRILDFALSDGAPPADDHDP